MTRLPFPPDPRRDEDETLSDEVSRYEIVSNDEPSMEEYEDIGPGPDANLVKYDEFGAPIAKVVKVRDGVRDTRAR